jgi:GAF domain-containing protein
VTEGTELLTAILDVARQRFGAAACSVAVVEGEELIFRAAVGAGAEQLIGTRLPLSRGIAGWTVASGQAIAVADVRRDQRFDRRTAERTGYIPTSILAAPVEDDDLSLGVLEVLDRDPGPRDLEMAAATAAQLAWTLGLIQSRRRLEALADPRLAGLVELVAQIAELGEQERSLAEQLLRVVVERAR